MSAPIPGELETGAQPPLRLPLAHFLVGFAFLLGGLAAGGLHLLAPSRGVELVHVHGLLVGWVAVTIMGAMTQFVPVWSGRALHSERLAAVQLALVAGGLPVFLAGFLIDVPALVPLGGLAMAAGLWTCCYNVGRSLPHVARMDVTERHFGYALVFFAAAAALGVGLAAAHGLGAGRLGPVAVGALVRSHAALAVYGGVLCTIAGAIYQLAAMFAQTDRTALGDRLVVAEETALPFGVIALAGAPLVAFEGVAIAGSLLVAVAVGGVGVVVLDHLRRSHVAPNAMLRRYALAGAAMVIWSALAVPAALDRGGAGAGLLAPTWLGHLLLVGVVAVTVLGSLYHVVPFLVWVERYSDAIGRRPIPMIDELYSARAARLDLALLVGGAAALIGGFAAAPEGPWVGAGAVAVSASAVLTVANLTGTVLVHWLGVTAFHPPAENPERVREN